MNSSTNKHVYEVSGLKHLMLQAEVFLRDVWRYRWASIITVWLIAVMGWIFVYTLPDKYMASSKILVDTDSILRPLLKGLAVETDLQSKLNMLTRTLLSRPNLEKLIRETDMDLNISSNAEKDKLIESLRNKIGIQSSGNRNFRMSRETLYTITYEHTNPSKAKELVQALLTIFIETTLGGSRQDSNIAQKFLERQIVEYEKKLLDAEKKLMDFKKKHIGMLPGQGRDFFGQLQDTKNEHENAKFQLAQAKKKHVELKRQLDEFVTSATKPESSSVSTSVDERIDELKKALDALLLRYTDEHPDVAELKQSIVLLEKQKEEELKLIVSGKATSSTLEANPVYQELKLSLGKASTDLETVKVSVDEYDRRIKKLQERVEVLPKIEAELASLNRDYRINKAQYDTLLARRESAKMSQEAENAGDQVKFQIVDPPHVPSEASSPNRPLLNSVVLFVALAGGIGLIYLFGQINPVIHEEKALKEITGCPVFGTVSLIRGEELISEHKRDIRIYAISMGILLFVYAGVLLYQVVL